MHGELPKGYELRHEMASLKKENKYDAKWDSLFPTRVT